MQQKCILVHNARINVIVHAGAKLLFYDLNGEGKKVQIMADARWVGGALRSQ